MVRPASLSDAQLESFANLLRQQKPEEIWGCVPADMDALIKGLKFESIPVATQ